MIQVVVLGEHDRGRNERQGLEGNEHPGFDGYECEVFDKIDREVIEENGDEVLKFNRRVPARRKTWSQASRKGECVGNGEAFMGESSEGGASCGRERSKAVALKRDGNQSSL